MPSLASTSAASNSGPSTSTAVGTETLLARRQFIDSTRVLLQLVVDGVPGILSSARSLRNGLLQRVDGDQNEAGRIVVESFGRPLLDDDEQLAGACLVATELPGALAQAMWLRLRRVVLLCELLGHDASASEGRVLCAAAGVVTSEEPLYAAAAHALWFQLCRKTECAEAAPSELACAFTVMEASAAQASLRVFAAGRQLLAPEEWRAPLEDVSVARARVVAEQLLKAPERRARAAARAGVPLADVEPVENARAEA
jgi:hypothetical protein